MNKPLLIAAVGTAVALVLLNRQRGANLPMPTLQGTKPVRLPRRHDPSGEWKEDLPIPTNLWGGHPYGYSGYPAGAYLPPDYNEPSDDYPDEGNVESVAQN